MISESRTPSNSEARGRRLVAQRSRGDCEARVDGVCTGRAQEWQHRKNRSQGGTWAAANGLHACAACHGYMHANPTESYENGWSVKQANDPRLMPVLALLYSERPIMLDDFGTWRDATDAELIRADTAEPTLPFGESA